MSLKCPLCCKESFDSPETLKNHLLDTLEKKMKCPICGENVALENITKHLRECENPGASNFNVENTAIQMKNENQGDQAVEDENYYCEICDVNFKEMKKHLKEYHMGQQVVVESQHLDEILEESNMTSGTEEPSSNMGTEHIFLEQEILDETGEFYTKKLTKINIIQENETRFPALEEISFVKAPNDNNQIKNSFKVYRCERCDVRFLNLLAYNAHECGSKKETTCDICSLYFLSKSGLSQHKKKFHAELLQDNLEHYICDICKIEFPSGRGLSAHKRMHTPKVSSKKIIDPPVVYNNQGEQISEESDELFSCEVCGKEYNMKYQEAHVRSHKEVILICSICNREFQNKHDLNLHLQAHGNDVEQKVSCRFCKKAFMQKTALEEHIKHHCEERKYSCSFCGRRFTKPHEKVKHERIHTGHKPHVCEICGKSFRVSYCLTLHLRTHSGVRPYECKTCGKRFKSHGSYSHHVQIHSDVRAYKCPYCPKAFKTSVQLAGHRNSHTKPFSCETCNRPFASLYAVKKHMKCHDTKDELRHKCHICGAEYVRNIALRDHLLTHPEFAKEDLEKYKKKDTRRTVKLEEGEVVAEILS